jgi:hypothetical protein
MEARNRFCVERVGDHRSSSVSSDCGLGAVLSSLHSARTEKEAEFLDYRAWRNHRRRPCGRQRDRKSYGDVEIVVGMGRKERSIAVITRTLSKVAWL